jgi:hypothetical protein
MAMADAVSADSITALRNSMRDLMIESVKYLSRFPLPIRQIMFPDFGPEGPMIGATGRYVLDAKWTIMPMQRVWKPWPQLQTILSVIKSVPQFSAIILADRSGAQIADEEWAVSVPMSQFLLDFVETVKAPAPTWNEEAFENLFAVFTESVMLGGYRLTVWTPLYNCSLRGIAAPIEVTPGISIAEPDENTRHMLLPTFTLDNPTMDAARYYIRAEERVAFHRYPSQATQLASGRVVVGVRLAVGGDAYLRETRAISEPGSCMTSGAFGSYVVGYQPRTGVFYFENPSLISTSDVEAIRGLTAAVPRLNDEFPIALSRFTSTTDRQQHADRLIDACIGLENLLLQGIQDELSFRLALRGAWLFGRHSSRTTCGVQAAQASV